MPGKITAENEVAPAWIDTLDSLAGNGDRSIKITVEMYEAGVAALATFDATVELEEEAVARIYRAMVRLAPPR